MTPPANAPTAIRVTGDIGVDVDIYHPGGRFTARPGRDTLQREHPSGAALLAALLSRIGAEMPDGRRFIAHGPGDDRDSSRVRRSFSLWQPVPADSDSADLVWRVTQPLGMAAGGSHPGGDAALDAWDRFDVIALVDDAQEFRHRAASAAWPALLRDGSGPVRGDKPASIILQMAAPICAGDLWRAVSAHCSDRVVAIVSASDIRRETVQVSTGLSWERTAMDLVREFQRHSALGELAGGCRRVIVTLGTEGALLVSRDDDGDRRARYRLIYDPGLLEHDVRSRLNGGVPGAANCLTAAVASYLASDTSDESLEAAVVAGLSAMRTALFRGHGPESAADPGFPFDAVAAGISAVRSSHGFATVRVPTGEDSAGDAGGHWSIIASSQGPHAGPLALYGAAHRVVRRGPAALGRIPHARFGRLFTVDRAEIEGLRTLAQLIDGYRRNNRGETPLSLGVFGPPGSGKSFCVKQVARSVCGEDVPFLEFNLSQFIEPRDFIGAFHQIRDKVLEGTMPFVFWDEFDSQEYRWLQYLLAPMQDGKFTENQLAHPLGKCVFVCAGGTSHDFRNFGPPSRSAEYAAFRMRKGPDFKSRLTGYLNVLGPNRRQEFDEATRDWIIGDEFDVCFPIRRALLIRSSLGASEGDDVKIDSAVLSALLEISTYAHGARSLQKLVTELAQRSAGGILQRSALPASDVLSMHVDYDEFMRLLGRADEIRNVASELAPRIHQYWRPLSAQNSPYNVEFDALPTEIQNDNRAAAERLARIVALIGLRVVPAGEPGTGKPESDVSANVSDMIERHLEVLAEEEHNGWVEQRERDGWRYGELRDDGAKRHPSLRPYHQLPFQEQEKDRNAVRKYPELIRSCGYRLTLIADAD